ncbi:response regulator [Paenibacillus sp. 1011MAR3C5]|uniref:response regulator n=1 Tax=Paenibacillus sp. 1011MAR3C5 TaxID=1675787 RepID=UPI000E6B98AA|nr:response regulator [Paenibacillus sp. 1011MAR3C5]RJE88707.1 response regulator [Paenibacillus sp. 1011MAR3C5]
MNRIAYIDDEEDVVRQFQIIMMDDFEVIELRLKDSVEEMVEDIIESKVSGVVIDYNLNSSQSKVHYNGVNLIRELLNTIKEFPCYILTSHESEAEGTLLDPEFIRAKEFVAKEKEFFVHKLKTKIESYEKRIELFKLELMSLMDLYPNLTSKEEERLIELDNILELNSNSYKSLPSDIKKISSDARLDRLIQLSEALVDEMRDETDD